jgi:Flp pilus assembly CpaE family ATPase
LSQSDVTIRTIDKIARLPRKGLALIPRSALYCLSLIAQEYLVAVQFAAEPRRKNASGIFGFAMKQELKLVSFIGQKGGVGKSSLARLLSVGAARERGKNIST